MPYLKNKMTIELHPVFIRYQLVSYNKRSSSECTSQSEQVNDTVVLVLGERFAEAKSNRVSHFVDNGMGGWNIDVDLEGMVLVAWRLKSMSTWCSNCKHMN